MDEKNLIISLDFNFEKNNNTNNNSDFSIILKIKDKKSLISKVMTTFKIHFFEFFNDYEFEITSKTINNFYLDNIEHFLISRNVFNKIKDELEFVGIKDIMFAEKVFNNLVSEFKSI